MTSGDIGILNQEGQQVGGFLDWEITPRLEYAPGRPPEAKITALGFWLGANHTSRVFDALFYKLVRSRLVLMQELEVEIDLPNVVTDKLIRRHIQMEMA